MHFVWDLFIIIFYYVDNGDKIAKKLDQIVILFHWFMPLRKCTLLAQMSKTVMKLFLLLKK